MLQDSFSDSVSVLPAVAPREDDLAEGGPAMDVKLGSVGWNVVPQNFGFSSHIVSNSPATLPPPSYLSAKSGSLAFLKVTDLVFQAIKIFTDSPSGFLKKSSLEITGRDIPP